MVDDSMQARVCASLPWGAADGVPEFVVPGMATSIDTAPPADRRAEVTVRVLPDGTPQLLAPTAFGARVMRLGRTPLHIDVRTRGQVNDAVLGADGSVIVLENIADAFDVRRVRPDGKMDWRMRDVGAMYLSRLLADSQGRVFLTAEDFLVRVDDSSGDVLAGSRPGPEAVMGPDGRIGFAAYTPERGVRDWVVLDLAGGTETVVNGSPDNWELLHRVLGIDAAGHVYGSGVHSMGSMSPTGEPEWHGQLQGITVAADHSITTMLTDRHRGSRLLDGSGRVIAELDPGITAGWLVGRTHDGYVCRAPAAPGEGELLHLDTQGHVSGRERLGNDFWKAYDFCGSPAASSVTPRGEVLVPVLSRTGVHILALSFGRTIR